MSSTGLSVQGSHAASGSLERLLGQFRMRAAFLCYVQHQRIGYNQERGFGRVTDTSRFIVGGGIERCLVAKHADTHWALKQVVVSHTASFFFYFNHPAI